MSIAYRTRGLYISAYDRTHTGISGFLPQEALEFYRREVKRTIERLTPEEQENWRRFVRNSFKSKVN